MRHTYMLMIKADLNKHIQHWDCGGRDGHQATVAVVHHKVRAQRFCREVINAACTVRHLQQSTALNKHKIALGCLSIS